LALPLTIKYDFDTRNAFSSLSNAHYNNGKLETGSFGMKNPGYYLTLSALTMILLFIKVTRVHLQTTDAPAAAMTETLLVFALATGVGEFAEMWLTGKD